ncbi:hypothetical protein SAMN04487764_3124 [Gillisia sp. Hel1_33_143]|nr:hypothetical protein SAMN04487764_3124 [Gillisia sp. Hel1_33_143]
MENSGWQYMQMSVPNSKSVINHTELVYHNTQAISK